MRRVGVVVSVGLGLVLASATAGFTAPAPTPATTGPAIPVGAATKPATVCTITTSSKGAVDLTGLVATKSGYVVVDGKNTNWAPYVVTLDNKCQRVGSAKSYSGGGADDPQDIAQDSNGTLWISDVGDTGLKRPSIGLWKLPASGSMTLYRFSYPDGPHNASAMILDKDGRPIFITRNGSGPAGLYEPAAGALKTGTVTPLVKVGQFTPEQTGTSNVLTLLGETWVTGAAKSPDGSKIVIRTTSDAYEFTVTGGDVVGAITKTTPTITPMPSPYEGQGEAITFTPDGANFLTLAYSDGAVPILQYTPDKTAAVTKSGAKAAAGPKKPGALRAWFNSLSLTDVKLLLGGVAVFGVILVGIGWLGIRRSRVAYRAQMAAAAKEKKAAARAAAMAPAGVGGGYGPPGGPPPPSGPPPPGGPPGVYGAPGRGPGGPPQGPPPAGPRGGPVYGGAPAGGGVYGAPAGPPGGNVYGAPGGGGRPPAGGGNVYGGTPAGSGGGVYGAPPGGARNVPPAYDPYAPNPDPYADPYAAPDPARPPGPPHGGQYPNDPDADRRNRPNRDDRY